MKNYRLLIFSLLEFFAPAHRNHKIPLIVIIFRIFAHRKSSDR